MSTPSLAFDPATITGHLETMPSRDDPFGRRPDVDPLELMTKLAPVYIEAGKFIRAMAMAGDDHRRFTYQMIPTPVLEPDSELVGLRSTSSTVFVNLTDATVTDTVPDAPFIALSIDFANATIRDGTLPMEHDHGI